MSDDIEFLKSENEKLHGETLALQWLLTCLMVMLRDCPAVGSTVVAKSFDCAADITEGIAIQLGKKAPRAHTVGALEFVEQLREQVFPDSPLPNRGVNN